ncbi:MAG TPA: SDR family NAD(P)-dependent oxidoreductase [Chloroflexota bacterium]|jgi:NAD(P)-dependent dehydrogenase (short-subunit alcohol dehydrogenase family)
MTTIAGKTIYITGGTSGMGLEAGQQLAGRGAHLVMLDRNPADAATRAVEAARRSPRQRVARYRLDVADREGVLTTVGQVVAECGAPDIVINMAGIGGVAEFHSMPFETFDRIMQVNLYGTRHLVAAVLPSMLARGSGKLVLVGSMGGLIPVYGYTAYGTSKFGVVGLAQCLRYELKPHGLSVACFCPGEVETPGLADERKTLHPAATALKKIGGTMPVETAVRGLIEGIRRDEFMIIPGFKVQLTYWLHRVLPDRAWNAITDALVAQALRNLPPEARQETAPA